LTQKKVQKPSEKQNVVLPCGFAGQPQALMPKPRPRRSAASREQRRLRIMAMAPDSFHYQETPDTEGLSRDRAPQIVVESLKRGDRDKEDHRRIQAARLAPALRLAMDSIRAGCLPAIDRLLKVLAAQDKYLAPPDLQSSREDIRAQLIAKLEMAARERICRSEEPPEQIPPPTAEARTSTAPGERADISPLLAPALASP
jgi:hypothetical protein